MDLLLAPALALGASLFWGSGDFVGGMLAKRIPAMAVLFWSAIAAVVLLGGGLLLAGVRPDSSMVTTGMAAGVFGGAALAMFYRGLAVGRMGVVAAISSTGVVLPVAFDLLRGDLPSQLTVAGMVLAIAGVVWLSSLEHDGSGPAAVNARQGIVLGFGAAIGFGIFFIISGSASDGTASSLWIVVGSKLGAMCLMAVGLTVTRSWMIPSRGDLGLIVVPGVLDTTANALFVIAAGLSTLSTSAVLASLYPAVTVLLARVVLHERLTRVQQVAIVVVVIGVVLISMGHE